MSALLDEPLTEEEILDALPLALAAAMAEIVPKMDEYDCPSKFVLECINWPTGMAPAPYQLRILDNVFKYGREAAHGPHTVGKTTTSALLVLYCVCKWEADRRFGRIGNWIIVTTASYWRQLKYYLWPSIKMWYRRLKWDKIGMSPFKEGVEVLDMEFKIGEHGRAFATSPINFEGAHADRVLVLNDEAKDIPAVTWEKEEGIFAGAGDDVFQKAYALAVSTPGPPIGTFADICHRKPGYEDWHATHVTSEEAIAAGRMSRRWRDQRRKQWGEDSAVYQNRALGNFYASEANGVVPLTWVEAAIARWHEMNDNGTVPAQLDCIGVDLADQGEDNTVFAPRYGMFIDNLRVLDRERPRTIIGRLFRVLSRLGGTAFIDILPNGNAIADRLDELACDARTFNGSERATYTQNGKEVYWRDRSGHFRFANRRCHALWNLRELLDPEYDPQLALPPDDDLIGDLTTPTYDVTSDGIIRVEAKDEFKKRLGRSPDKGDATMIACYPHETYDPGSAVFGVATIIGASR